jgi:hypothetical protein
MALALGARVGMIDASESDVSLSLSRPMWSAHPQLSFLPAEASAVRRFLER